MRVGSRLWRRVLGFTSMLVSGLGRRLQPTSRAGDPELEMPLVDPSFTHTLVGAGGGGGGGGGSSSSGKSATVEDMGRGELYTRSLQLSCLTATVA